MSASIAPLNAQADADTAVRRSQKAEDAYRTISEVADELHVAQHVLRFWESKFKQIEPLKRAGGRRYYSRENVALLKRVHYLLYTQGYTIKGVQKMLLKDRALLSAVPDLDAALAAKPSASLLPPGMAHQPTPRVDDHVMRDTDDTMNGMSLFTASDRIVMNDVLQRLKDIRRNLAS